ncbi:MAG: hypothetical protein ACRC42_03015, partial [Mycoplasma sp.]
TTFEETIIDSPESTFEHKIEELVEETQLDHNQEPLISQDEIATLEGGAVNLQKETQPEEREYLKFHQLPTESNIEKMHDALEINDDGIDNELALAQSTIDSNVEKKQTEQLENCTDASFIDLMYTEEMPFNTKALEESHTNNFNEISEEKVELEIKSISERIKQLTKQIDVTQKEILKKTKSLDDSDIEIKRHDYVSDIEETYQIKKQLADKIESEDFANLSTEIQSRIFDNYESTYNSIRKNDPTGIFDPENRRDTPFDLDGNDDTTSDTVTKMLIEESLNSNYICDDSDDFNDIENIDKTQLLVKDYDVVEVYTNPETKDKTSSFQYGEFNIEDDTCEAIDSNKFFEDYFSSKGIMYEDKTIELKANEVKTQQFEEKINDPKFYEDSEILNKDYNQNIIIPKSELETGPLNEDQNKEEDTNDMLNRIKQRTYKYSYVDTKELHPKTNQPFENVPKTNILDIPSAELKKNSFYYNGEKHAVKSWFKRWKNKRENNRQNISSSSLYETYRTINGDSVEFIEGNVKINKTKPLPLPTKKIEQIHLIDEEKQSIDNKPMKKKAPKLFKAAKRDKLNSIEKLYLEALEDQDIIDKNK